MENNVIDCSVFESVERHELIRIFRSWEKYGLPNGFRDDEVKIVLNPRSYVLVLINADELEASLDSDEHIKIWHTLPSGDIEGFMDDILYENKPEDLDCRDVLYIQESIEYQDLLDTGNYPAWKNYGEEADEEE